jgi:hypothetical protein
LQFIRHVFFTGDSDHPRVDTVFLIGCPHRPAKCNFSVLRDDLDVVRIS